MLCLLASEVRSMYMSGDQVQSPTRPVAWCVSVVQFRAFFGCMLSHQEYYQPFLEATGVDVDKSQEAIDATKAKGQQQQQQQPQENGGQQPPPQQPPQHQQQQGLISKDAGSRSRSRSSSSKTGSS